MRNRVHSARPGHLARASMIVIGIALGLAVAELLALVFGFRFRPHMRNRVYFAEPDPALGWRNRAGIAGPYGGDEFLTWVTMNAAGQRGAAHPVERVTGKRRIAVLGDSQAWGDGVADTETFAARLDRGAIEVLNFAVIGYGTDQELLTLERVAAPYRPDIVVITAYVGNDFRDNTTSGTWQYAKPRFVLGEDGALRLEDPPHVPAWFSASVELYRGAMRYSALLDALAEATANPEPIRPSGFRGWESRGRPVRGLFAPEPPEEDREGLVLTARLLVEIARKARAMGAEPVVLILPEMWQVEAANDPAWRAELKAAGADWRRPQKVLRRALEKEGVPVIDALQPLARVSRDPTVATPTFYPSWKHLTPLGHEAIADLLRSRLGLGSAIRKGDQNGDAGQAER